MTTEGFIPPHGGYEQLVTYQKALVIFQATFYLAQRWVRIGSRTRDQMEQAARSGKQNIVEGSLAAATSAQTEIHLTNVARASLGELLEDFRDFLLDQQIRQQEQEFLKHGGIRERMTKARLEVRAQQDSAAAPPVAPACPLCNKPMRERAAKTGAHAGRPFWGCSAYPACRGIRSMEG